MNAARNYGIELVGPLVQDQGWQAREQSGYDLAHFAIEWDKHQAICPQGQRSAHWYGSHDQRGLEVIEITFARATCLACPARSQCTRSATQGRHLQTRPQHQHEAIQRVRAAQTTIEFHRRYRPRMGLEGTFSQAIRAFGLRRSRYIGRAKTHFQLVATAVAINLERFADYLVGIRPIARRSSAFSALAAT